MRNHRFPVASISAMVLCALAGTVSAGDLTQAEARAELRRIVQFYRTEVGYRGAYLWRYSADLRHQEGEGIALKTGGWTQPPGAPSVGEAYLQCWRLTEDRQFLDAAVEVAHALVESQLKSGGWSSHFDLSRAGHRAYCYRVDGDNAGRNNRTTFDDDKSQSALTLLMHVDEALDFSDPSIHDAVTYALQHMLAAQYPNGAWPQQYSEPPDPAEHPVRKASYPDTWPRTYPGKTYIGYYTLNDSNMSNIIDMLFEANRIYERDDCFEAAKRTGDFFLLAQMPDPQPGWAQQYNQNMHPAWARKFEPASVTGGESQSVMRSLLTLYRFTRDRRFISTLPRAITFYRSSLLPDGRLARFYELQTNRPLYFTKDYKLTYSDADMPTHYAFKVGSNLDRIERDYKRLAESDPETVKPEFRVTKRVKATEKLQREATQLVNQLDERGAWVEKGTMRHQKDALDVIDMRTYARNLAKLAAWAGARK